MLRYFYTGSVAPAPPNDTTELYVAGTFKMFTLKYSHVVSKSIFGVANSRNSGCLDRHLPIMDNLTLTAHVGHQIVKNTGGAGTYPTASLNLATTSATLRSPVASRQPMLTGLLHPLGKKFTGKTTPYVDQVHQVVLNPTGEPVMKLVTAIIKPFKLDEVREALAGVGVQGITVTEVKGFGRQKSHRAVSRCRIRRRLLPKVKVEVAVKTELVERVIRNHRKTANTSKIGDGKIFVFEVEQVIRIRTGETGRTRSKRGHPT